MWVGIVVRVDESNCVTTLQLDWAFEPAVAPLLRCFNGNKDHLRGQVALCCISDRKIIPQQSRLLLCFFCSFSFQYPCRISYPLRFCQEVLACAGKTHPRTRYSKVRRCTEAVSAIYNIQIDLCGWEAKWQTDGGREAEGKKDVRERRSAETVAGERARGERDWGRGRAQKGRRAKVDAGAVHGGEDATSAVTCRPPPTTTTTTPQPSVNETAHQTHAEGLHQGKDGINIYLTTKYIQIDDYGVTL